MFSKIKFAIQKYSKIFFYQNLVNRVTGKNRTGRIDLFYPSGSVYPCLSTVTGKPLYIYIYIYIYICKAVHQEWFVEGHQLGFYSKVNSDQVFNFDSDLKLRKTFYELKEISTYYVAY